MNVDDLIRSPKEVLKAVRSVGLEVVAVKPVDIIVPERYAEKGLMDVGETVTMLGVYALVHERHYAVSLLNARITVKPTSISTIKINQVSHLKLSFEPGASVIVTREVLTESDLVFEIFNEFVTKGKCPWFMGYDDMARLFETAAEYGDMKRLADLHAITAMIIAAISRNKRTMTQYYRHAIQDNPESERATISLKNITFGATNTVTRLNGSYWGDGLVSALVNPSDEVEKIEELLRR